MLLQSLYLVPNKLFQRWRLRLNNQPVTMSRYRLIAGNAIVSHSLDELRSKLEARQTRGKNR
jgi:hypothetical protein